VAICDKCGLAYGENYPPDQRYHRRRHDVFVNGPKIDLSDGVHLVLPTSPLRHRKAAQTAAGIFQWEMKYDFSAYHATSRDDFKRNRTRALIYVLAGRVVGLLVGREWRCRFYRTLPNEKAEERPETQCLRLDVVWVAEPKRRQGIGRCLVSDFLAELADLPLAVQPPISDGGRALLRSLGLTGFWIG
jgi:GNAT superfamily N-acetyltransferase